ncbi:hypothetical protein C0992_002234, partial [Termitomyces sp. T32_za158]
CNAPHTNTPIPLMLGQSKHMLLLVITSIVIVVINVHCDVFIPIDLNALGVVTNNRLLAFLRTFLVVDEFLRFRFNVALGVAFHRGCVSCPYLRSWRLTVL